MKGKIFSHRGTLGHPETLLGMPLISLVKTGVFDPFILELLRCTISFPPRVDSKVPELLIFFELYLSGVGGVVLIYHPHCGLIHPLEFFIPEEVGKLIPFLPPTRPEGTHCDGWYFCLFDMLSREERDRLIADLIGFCEGTCESEEGLCIGFLD